MAQGDIHIWDRRHDEPGKHAVIRKNAHPAPIDCICVVTESGFLPPATPASTSTRSKDSKSKESTKHAGFYDQSLRGVVLASGCHNEMIKLWSPLQNQKKSLGKLWESEGDLNNNSKSNNEKVSGLCNAGKYGFMAAFDTGDICLFYSSCPDAGDLEIQKKRQFKLNVLNTKRGPILCGLRPPNVTKTAEGEYVYGDVEWPESEEKGELCHTLARINLLTDAATNDAWIQSFRSSIPGIMNSGFSVNFQRTELSDHVKKAYKLEKDTATGHGLGSGSGNERDVESVLEANRDTIDFM